MKIQASVVCLFAFAATSFGQGIITFYNDGLIGTNREPYRAGIYRQKPLGPGDPIQGDRVGAGAGYTAALYLASDPTKALAMTTFRTTFGTEVFAETQDVVIPGVHPGQTANLIIRVWDTAQPLGGQRGEMVFTTRALGGPNPDPTQPPIQPPDLGPGFKGFEMFIPVGSTPSPRGAAHFEAASVETAPKAATFTTAPAQQGPRVTINVILKPGTNLISNPLLSPDDSIDAVFRNIQGGVPSGTKVFRLVNGKFITALWSILDNKFIPQTVASQRIPPGEGVLLFLPGNIDKVLTFSGQSQQGQMCTTIPNGFSLKANMAPVDLKITDSGIRFSGGDRMYVLNTGTGRYERFVYDDLGEAWEPILPVIPAGQAFFWYNYFASRMWCEQALGVSRNSGDELRLEWALATFGVESSTDLRNWSQFFPPGNTNMNLPVSLGQSFFRLRRQ